MAKKKKILFIVEAMGGGVFTYIVDLANELVKEYDMYIAYAVRRQTPDNYKDYFDRRINLIEVKNFSRSINPMQWSLGEQLPDQRSWEPLEQATCIRSL